MIKTAFIILLFFVTLDKSPSRYPDVWLFRSDPGYCPEVSGRGWSGDVSWPTEQKTIREGRGFSVAHPAIDIVGQVGDPVNAAASGVVTWAGWSQTSGNLVVLAHGAGWRTYYAHLDSVDVVCGQYVLSGQYIGELGKTRTSWPHLHFEVERKEQGQRWAHNPLNWLRGEEYAPGEVPFSRQRPSSDEESTSSMQGQRLGIGAAVSTRTDNVREAGCWS
jgi:hypothetical protein